ncbi:MAG: hypothetical protein L0I76_04400 [Pseudonocardia sp.]|nr:hypothetical protein [Pseudonocardia sp.]
MTRSLRALLVLAVGVVVLPLIGGTASAHSGGLESEAFLPRVLALDPPVPGLEVSVVEGGARLGIVNRTGQRVEVLPPEGLARAEEPVVQPGGRGHWADRRVAAASVTRPAEASPVAWTVPLLVGSEPVVVRGETVWPPPPAGGGWWAATVALAAAATVLGVLSVRRERFAPVVVVLAVVAVGAHLVHVLGSALVPIDLSYWPAVFGTAGIGVGAWALGSAGAVLTFAGRRWGLLLCSLGGAVLALVTAFDTASFTSSVLPYGWSPTLDRVSTVTTVGIGFGLFLTGFAVLRGMTPDDLDLDDPAADDPPPSGAGHERPSVPSRTTEEA